MRNCRVIVGDALTVLKTLPPESVHCVVTSPPYWGLRDYGTAKWEGGDLNCDHSHFLGGNGSASAKQVTSAGTQKYQYRDVCQRCGAVRVDAQMGLERTPEEYIGKMVKVFREVRRVLRKDGTVWVNMGDCYATGAGSRRSMGGDCFGKYPQCQPNRLALPGLKPKDLVGIPWALAFALRADGWWLRSDIIWSKPNPKPESVTDRPTKAHEYIFLLTKSERYFYDAEAIKEERQGETHARGSKRTPPIESAGIGHRDWCAYMTKDDLLTSRNKRTVWEIATSPFPEAHFATFPPKLVDPCIKAGTSEHGCCPECGAPWERVVTVGYDNPGNRTTNGPRSTENRDITAGFSQRLEKRTETTGWRPTCSCGKPETVPCTVLDPFSGAGTTGLVATRLQRNFIGIELNPEYAEMALRRIKGDAPMFNNAAEVRA